MIRALPILPLVLLLAAAAAGQETPAPDSERQPEVDDNSTQGPVPAPLPPPLARPPEGLELVVGSPLGRALGRLDRAEVLDSLGIRAVRRTGDDSGCELLLAAGWEGSLALDQARAEVTSAAALLETPSGDPAASAGMVARLAGLRARLADLEQEVERVDRLGAGASCEGRPGAPVWLPSAERAAVAGIAAILVRTDGPGKVVWIDGAPEAVAGAGGWVIAVVPVGLRRICAAEPEEARCPTEVEIDAEMGAGFDLR